MRNKDKTKKFTSQTFLPGSLHSFIPNSFLPSPVMTGRMGIAVSASQLLLAAPFYSKFFLLQHVTPSMG